jgi:hypothetical protein
MNARRRFLKLSLTAAASSLFVTRARAEGPQPSAFIPMAAALPLVIAPGAAPISTPTPTSVPIPTPSPTLSPVPGDANILGSASGSVDQTAAWLIAYADPSYTPSDLRVIVESYQRVGESVGIDWFVAVAQMAHETGNLTSFWSLRPQRNPAGIGVTGVWQSDPPADQTGWAYNTQRSRWERGISFPTWADDAIPAHLGRLLAYALTDAQANAAQRAMITKALSYRGITNTNRGTAQTWVGLNGRWAVPGATYGQTILSLAQRIRQG